MRYFKCSYTCTTCDEKFKESYHAPTCVTCGKKFASQLTLQIHLKTQNIKDENKTVVTKAFDNTMSQEDKGEKKTLST